MRQYLVAEGHLVLEHHYPRGRSEPSTVSVDINDVVESMNSEQLRVGAWLNVLGYIRDATTPASSFTSSQMESQLESSQSFSLVAPAKLPPRPVYVEAVMVFSAGAIAVGEYERILRQAQDVEQRINQ